MPDEVRHDAEVQDAARVLFEGITPERSKDLSEFWTHYGPRFSVVADSGSAGLFVLEGGRYRDVWFNHRAMRVFWLAAFIAWEGFEHVHELATTGTSDYKRFNEMLEVFFRILKEEDPSTIKLPAGVPEPGTYLDNPSARAAGELATFAVGWAMLHEIRHLQHQQEGTGAKQGASSEEYHAEELSCDEFATNFILEKIGTYASLHGVAADQIRQKRQMGIFFAMFAMTLIGNGCWTASDSHPAVQTRIDATIKQMSSNGRELSDVVAHAAFAALWLKWPDAPGPFKL